MHSQWPSPENIAGFSYSRLSHFTLFNDLPFKSYNVGDPNPTICDLKVYQDYLTYCFIRRNVRPGARILEVGGGDSRILKFFSSEYECWNADKCEGLGNGPTKFTSPHYRIVYDYVGSFNKELPDDYFDFVFSISALEHTPEDQAIRVNVLKDMNRVLKPGGFSFHCFDAILRPAGASWVNGLIPYIYANAPLLTKFVPLSEIDTDADTYVMSQHAYDANWKPITKDDYSIFGRPFSLNLSWRNS
ncbi:Methyltransferase domain-containing protein [Opitutus sp. GAS368]|nr:Methyltransferase domain-containing protein [Opitutus sp. GAS368]